MSLASETRRAVRDRPFLLAGLRAGVVNYTAAADLLDLDGEHEAVATALRRYAEDLPPFETDSRSARVTMQRGVGLVEIVTSDDGAAGNDEGATDDGDEGATDDGDKRATDDSDADPGDATTPLLTVGGAAIRPDAGDETAVMAVGDDVDVDALTAVLTRLAAADVDVSAAGVAGGTLLVVVGRRKGAAALRLVEGALDAVPVRAGAPATETSR